jgi:hypothetical protein
MRQGIADWSSGQQNRIAEGERVCVGVGGRLDYVRLDCVNE